MSVYINERVRYLARSMRSEPLLAVAMIMMVLVPLLAAPSMSYRWHGLKSVGYQVGCIVLLCAMISMARFDRLTVGIKRLWSKAPNRWLCAVIAWALLSFGLSPDKQFAGTALIQLVGGALIFFCISQKLNSRAQYELILDVFVGVAILGSLAGFVMYGNSVADQGGGLFVDHQLFGAFLMLMLPIMLVTGFMPTKPIRRMSAQIASVLCASCLLLARTRASWIGEAFALTLLAVLAYKYYFASLHEARTTGERRNRAAAYIMPAVALVSALVIFICLSNLGGSFSQRAFSVEQSVNGQDSSFESRVQAWNGTIRMIAAKPIMGWGIGTYALHQEQFTHVGSPRWAVLRHGPSLSEQAHDYYLQTAAETGIVGLVLWIGFLVTLFSRAFTRLPALATDSIRQRVLVGCVSALAGQVIDSLANPSWQFGDLMLFFWVMAGISMAATGTSEVRAEDSVPLTDVNASLSGTGLFVQRGLRVIATGICGLALLGAVLDTSWVLPAEAYCGTPCTYRCTTDSGCSNPAPAPCLFSIKSKTSCILYSCGDSGYGYQLCDPTSCVLSCPSGDLSCTCSGSKITLNNPKKTCTGTLLCTFSDGGTCSVSCSVGP
ncbi:MAG: O-antigen ligase family protein [Capsulimonadaceae bacterium]